MAKKTSPKGTMIRARRDWAIRDLMIGSSDFASNASGQTGRIVLSNNSTSGDILALYGVLAMVTNQPPLVHAFVSKKGPGTFTPSGIHGGQQPFFPDGAAAPGLIGYDATSSGNDNAIWHIWATGQSWLYAGEAPLAVIPVNYQFYLQPDGSSGLFYATFLWGRYNPAS